MIIPGAFSKVTLRYAIYCMTNGAKSPAEMKEIDAKRRFGMSGYYSFSMWIQSRWDEWCELNKRERYSNKTKQDHENFDKWLIDKCLPQTK